MERQVVQGGTPKICREKLEALVAIIYLNRGLLILLRGDGLHEEDGRTIQALRWQTSKMRKRKKLDEVNEKRRRLMLRE